jgi:small conductance mechanosensitive channel
VLGRQIQAAGLVLALLVALTRPPGPSARWASAASRRRLPELLAGILILLLEPLRIGDQIILADYEGTIEETRRAHEVVILDAEPSTKPVVVNTAYPERQLEKSGSATATTSSAHAR